ncbi:MAG: S41 family peptidase [Acidobacteria bacterium]|nr:S41 family peptidase [Acidobacteriota bacterium]
MLEWLPNKEKPSSLVYAGIDGMLEKLDPHSNFLDPAAFAKMKARQRGSFFGVGIIISMRGGKVTVLAPIAGTPAAKIGLRAGDVISAIDGQSTAKMTLDDVLDHVRGPEGTVVKLTIVRPGLSQPLEVSITRARIPTNSVRFAFMLRPGVGYIRLTEFSATSSREVHQKIHELETQGMRSLIFDLRNNPGGSLDAAVGVSDTFLRKGQLIVFTRGRTKDSNMTFKAPGTGIHFNGPLVVLVNTGSASASEIVSGAIQDHDRGLLVGDVTWGKGLVQTVFTIRDTGLALTTARYYTPSGRCIQRDYHSYIEYITHQNANTGAAPATAKYHTDDGRPVRGGGGITPDIEVKARQLDEGVAQLYGRSAFFQFAIELLENVPQANYPQFGRAFAVTPGVLTRFWTFVEKKKLLDPDLQAKVKRNPEAMSDLRRAIKIEVLNSTLGLEAGYREMVTGDNQIAAALRHMPDAVKMWNAWQKRWAAPAKAAASN